MRRIPVQLLLLCLWLPAILRAGALGHDLVVCHCADGQVEVHSVAEECCVQPPEGILDFGCLPGSSGLARLDLCRHIPLASNARQRSETLVKRRAEGRQMPFAATCPMPPALVSRAAFAFRTDIPRRKGHSASILILLQTVILRL